MPGQTDGGFDGTYRRKFSRSCSFAVPRPWLGSRGFIRALVYEAGEGLIVRVRYPFTPLPPDLETVELNPLTNGRASISNILALSVDLLRDKPVVLVGRGEYFVMVEDAPGWETAVEEVCAADPVTKPPIVVKRATPSATPFKLSISFGDKTLEGDAQPWRRSTQS
jgi:hypothetical protein